MGGEHSADFGKRSVGIIADQYDEFFYYGGFGLTSIGGTREVKDVPRNFLANDEAKKFLNFNEDIASFSGTLKSGEYYTREIDGKSASRVIYTPAITHPRVAFSTSCVAFAVDFFGKALGAPNAMAPAAQIWPWKTFFNAIGLLAFFAFLASFALAMLGTSYFKSLATAEPVAPPPNPSARGKAWFWGSAAAAAAFSGLSFGFILDKMVTKKAISGLFPQTSTLAIGIWCVVCAAFAVLLLWLYYARFGRENDGSLRERGVALPRGTFWKTVLLALLTLGVAFAVLFFADYFFKADFRFFVIALRAFKAPTALVVLRFVPFFLVFYVINSVSINCFNYNDLGKNGWANILAVSIFNALGLVVYDAIQYGAFFSDGKPPFRGTLGLSISGIWAYPAMFFLFVTPFVTRAIYKHTKNPYIGGIINAVVVAAMCCANTATVLAS